jgi:hypothetical protein
MPQRTFTRELSTQSSHLFGKRKMAWHLHYLIILCLCQLTSKAFGQTLTQFATLWFDRFEFRQWPLSGTGVGLRNDDNWGGCRPTAFIIHQINWNDRNWGDCRPAAFIIHSISSNDRKWVESCLSAINLACLEKAHNRRNDARHS